MTVEERLNKLLAQSEYNVEELEGQVRDLEEKLKLDTSWAAHSERDSDGGLPVPRLEIEWTELHDSPDEYTWLIRYNLVYQHLCDHFVVVPLGSTKTSGSYKTLPLDELGHPKLPYRDGAHISHDAIELNLPAFVVHENAFVQIDTSKHTGANEKRKKRSNGSMG